MVSEAVDRLNSRAVKRQESGKTRMLSGEIKRADSEE